jgi:hypothetical protein
MLAAARAQQKIVPDANTRVIVYSEGGVKRLPMELPRIYTVERSSPLPQIISELMKFLAVAEVARRPKNQRKPGPGSMPKP